MHGSFKKAINLVFIIPEKKRLFTVLWLDMEDLLFLTIWDLSKIFQKRRLNLICIIPSNTQSYPGDGITIIPFGFTDQIRINESLLPVTETFI